MTSGSAFYFHFDGLGSVSNLTSSTGATQWTYEYHPFGAARTTTQNASKAPANLIQFAAQYLDPTGLYHMRARQYDPSTGRFTANDPAVPLPIDPFVSSYVYAKDNPNLFVDPTGRDTNGVCINAQDAYGFLFGEGSLCIVVSDTGQGGVVLTGGGGGGIGLGVTVGVSGLHSDAAEIYDLEGPFVVGGGDVSAGVGVQAETFIGAGHCGQIVGGGTGGVAVGATGSGHVGATGALVLFGLGAPKSGCNAK